MPSSAFIPRPGRIRALADRAFERHRRAGSLQAGILAISATFGENRRINDRKLAVENAMCAGAGAIWVRHEYGKLALGCPANVTGALQVVERLYRGHLAEHRARQMAGFPLRHPEVEHRLIEARIFLRWCRRFGDRDQFPEIVDALTTSTFYAVAAE